MAWSLETIEKGRVGRFPALVDYFGIPSVLYTSSNATSIRFARRINETWVTSRIKKSENGVISSISAEDSINGPAVVTFIDRPRRLVPNSVSEIFYGTFDGDKWTFESVISDSFNSRMFYNAKITKIDAGTFVGWVQRNSNGLFELAFAQRDIRNWSTFVTGEQFISTSWDMANVGGELAVAFYNARSRQLRYMVRDNDTGWKPSEGVVTLSGKMSISGISLTGLFGKPQITYQVNFANLVIPGAQRRVQRIGETTDWVEDIIDHPIATSGFRDGASSISHFGVPAVAYHTRSPDVLNFAIFVAATEYDPYSLDIWITEEVGPNLVMPCLKYIGTQARIAVYDKKNQSAVLAEEI
tara:strand:- start:239 stop:1303 length:1065 start_codon:yes stop_codon:yes gene_type:complete